ncbi:MAG: ABC transporter permease, partial [Clostridia bacterium]|nr:ABC transporter permease [Clostridia bacterium]
TEYKFIELSVSSVSENVTLASLAIKGDTLLSFSDGAIKDYDGNAVAADTPVTEDGIKVRIDLEASGLSGAETLEIYAGGEGFSGAVSVTAKGIKDKSETDVTFYNYKEDLSDFGDENVEKITLSSDERVEVKYTDPVEIVINMMNNVISLITYALVVFTALSLVVSTVMVGIITYVSVVERVKEIGVIRSLGGRRRDVSALFIAETFVIGLSSGLFGVAVTWLLCLFGNAIVNAVSNGSVSSIAHLTWQNALIMISISVILTLISGLIPARGAARKNPVEALRTE